MSVENLSRRGFLGAGSGLVLGFTFPGCAAHLPLTDDTIRLGAPAAGPDHALNAWIRVDETGAITLRMAAAEMGQGVYTSLPMLLAEELDADWTRVRVESAPTAAVYRHSNVDFPGSSQLTGGSLSVRGYWDELREAGAAARAMLVQAAAQRFGVSPDECRTSAGTVTAGDQKASYGELAAEASLLDPPSKPALKDPTAFALVGTSPPRLDLPSKVDGSAVFGMDVAVPGMLIATVRACPHHGGTLVSFDDAAARAVPGVRTVVAIQDEEAVAVVADSFWAAKKGASALEITWDPGEGKGLDDARVRERLLDALDHQGKLVFRHGDGVTDDAFAQGGMTVLATYEVPYLEHAPIEPLCATAHVQADRVDVWAPTQAQQMVKANAARITGVPKDRVFIHTTFLGGGFGRKSFWDFTDQAVKLSKEMAAPVKVIWTREECFARGFYRPAALCRQRAVLGPNGLPTHWHVEMASQSILEAFLPGFLLGLKLATDTITEGMSEAPYAIPHQRVDYARVSLPIPVGWWRSVHGSHNGFFRECFLDELAHAAGQDPIAYRRALLHDNPRFLACFDLAVGQAGALPEGQHRGVALFESFGSIVAEVADVTVAAGTLEVHRVTAAIDCGMVVHPDTVRAQVSSGIGMGLSAMLYGKLSFVDGAVQETNFHQYRLMPLAQMPEVDVHIVPSTERPGGVGEVGLPPVAGAVGNAIFAATGRRIRKRVEPPHMAGHAHLKVGEEVDARAERVAHRLLERAEVAVGRTERSVGAREPRLALLAWATSTYAWATRWRFPSRTVAPTSSSPTASSTSRPTRSRPSLKLRACFGPAGASS
jgi:isoquinoline 1-oxidoreductase beta subunit